MCNLQYDSTWLLAALFVLKVFVHLLATDTCKRGKKFLFTYVILLSEPLVTSPQTPPRTLLYPFVEVFHAATAPSALVLH
jgi:hypothetical protein